MLDDDRIAKIIIGDTEYPMLLTTKATKEIGKRYGGLGNLGDKLLNNENFEFALDEVVWLITLLANQPILIHNMRNSDKKELLTEDEIELFTTPLELGSYKNAIMEAMYNGTKRNIQSESENEEPKNMKAE